MERVKQPYIVNPIEVLNPYEIINIPKRKVVAEIDTRGRFKKVVDILKNKKRKAKKISAKKAKSLMKKALVEKKVAHKKVTHKKTTKGKKAFRTRIKNLKQYKEFLKTIGVKPTKKERELFKKYNINPLMIYNPKRRKAMKSRKYRKNPFIQVKEGKELVNLAIDGSLIVGGTILGKLIVDKVSEKVPFLRNPYFKIGSNLVLGSAVYLLGKNFKKVPARIVRLASLGIMLPAIVDLVDIAKAKLGNQPSVKQLSDYSNDEVSAYVPEVSAYVPETSAYVPETSAYVPETSAYGDNEL